MSGTRRKPATGPGAKPVLITGGAGFIGANLAHRLLSEGERVVLSDNLSRPGVEENYRWLSQTHGAAVSLRVADTRDPRALGRAVEEASAVFHLAAQVAVTSSPKDPVLDRSVNALGTFNLLGAMRAMAVPPPLVVTSTNKVCGSLAGVELRVRAGRYEPRDEAMRQSGIHEGQALEFYSPYGCSKGAADQYALDHTRSFGLPAVVFRMSCIYGLHQFGTEDQGWVAHFLIKALAGERVCIYGDGRQVRDVLFIDDLVEAFLRARAQTGALTGQAFNLVGGPANTCSLLELNELIAAHVGKAPRAEFGPWRMGDQRYYVSETRKFTANLVVAPTAAMLEALDEEYGLGILEAGLAGCALVVSDLPSLREVWQEAALFLDPRDPEAWRRTLVALAADPGRRKELGEKARNRALRFTPQRMADNYLAVYGAILSAFGVPETVDVAEVLRR